MIDAYAIGIQLTLENGVSNGLALIGRDLLTLNRTVDGLAGGLTRLRQAADGLGIGISEDLARITQPALHVVPPPIDGDRTAATPETLKSEAASARPSSRITAPAQSDLARSDSPSPLPPMQRQTSASPPRVTPSEQVLRSLQSPIAPADIPKRDDAPKRQSEPHIPFRIDVAQPERVNTSAAPVARAVSVNVDPVSPTHRPSAAAAPAVLALRQTQPPSPIAPPSRPSAPSALSLPLSRPATPKASSALSVSVDTGSPPPQPEAAVFPAVSAPRRAIPSFARASGALAAPSLAPSYPSAAPPAPRRTGPAGGDVYLDGNRLGHWISDRLARDANRAPAGGTAFDPRMTLAWPGAPIGN